MGRTRKGARLLLTATVVVVAALLLWHGPRTDASAKAFTVLATGWRDPAAANRILPELMAGGCAFLDFDGDGDQDALLTYTRSWQEAAKAGTPTLGLWRNDGTGTFADATVGSGLDVNLRAMGVAAADYDGDGYVDLFVTAVDGNRLFHNTGGAFTDVTETAGVGGHPRDWSTGCAWLDCDRDGDLDLFVCNYVRWDRPGDLRAALGAMGATGLQLRPGQATQSRLYRNRGDGTFADETAAAGIEAVAAEEGGPLSYPLAVASIDFDGDGWVDLVLSGHASENRLLHNRGDGSFADVGGLAGLGFDALGSPTEATGVCAAELDNGAAIAFGALAGTPLALYRGEDLLLTDVAAGTALAKATAPLAAFGVGFLDVDLDGRLDLLVTGGHAERVLGGRPSAGALPVQLFRGGERGFEPQPALPADADLSLVAARGHASGDIDGDGDLDVLVATSRGPPLLLRNDQRGHHWLRVRLVGRTPNRNAIGAKLELEAGGRMQRRHVVAGGGYLSQSELVQTFGLGPATRIDRLRITWPDGTEQVLADLAADRLLVVEQER